MKLKPWAVKLTSVKSECLNIHKFIKFIMKHFYYITPLIWAIGFSYFFTYKKNFNISNWVDRIIALITFILFIVSILILVSESIFSKKKFRNVEDRLRKSTLLVLTYLFFIGIIIFVIERLFILFLYILNRLCCVSGW